MDKLIKNYQVRFSRYQNINNVNDMLQDFVSEVCSAIDDDLIELSGIVENKDYSRDEIVEKIEEIRKKIY